MPAEFDLLTSTLRPATDAIITLRVIKSFEYRTERNFLILKDIDLTRTTVGDLLELAKKCELSRCSRRLYTKAHGSKTTNLIINLENDDWILSDHSKRYKKNETKISLFNRTLYEAYKLNPVEKW
ncbi:hypothetical protein V1522DRAFT_439934 [Lipomyces starkeyi]